MTEDKFIKLAQERFDQAEHADQEQRERELDDLEFYSGDQWSDDAKTARAGQQAVGGLPPTPERPTLTINKVREPVRQVLNMEESAEFNVEIAPADDFGDMAQPNPRTRPRNRGPRRARAHDSAFAGSAGRAVVGGQPRGDCRPRLLRGDDAVPAGEIDGPGGLHPSLLQPGECEPRSGARTAGRQRCGVGIRRHRHADRAV